MSSYIFERLDSKGFHYFDAFGRDPVDTYPRMPRGNSYADRLRNEMWFMGIYRGSRGQLSSIPKLPADRANATIHSRRTTEPEQGPLRFPPARH